MFSRVAARVASKFVAPSARAFSVTPARFAPVYFAKSHEWIDIDGDKATVGISDFAQKELGDVVYVDLPDVGSSYGAGDSFSAVESVKATSDVYLPVAGTVAEVNEALTDTPELINSAPEGDGWIVKLSGVAAPEGLMNPEEYKAFCDAQ